VFSAFQHLELEPYKPLSEGKYAMSTGNTNLKRHIRNCHSELWHANAPKYGWKNLDLQVSTQSIVSQGKLCEEFDVEKFHEHVVSFIVADNQVS
jgi:hypothetical protein